VAARVEDVVRDSQEPNVSNPKSCLLRCLSACTIHRVFPEVEVAAWCRPRFRSVHVRSPLEQPMVIARDHDSHTDQRGGCRLMLGGHASAGCIIHQFRRFMSRARIAREGPQREFRS
jgi:hypothetical protein